MRASPVLLPIVWAAVGATFPAVVSAGAETCALQLRRLEPLGRIRTAGLPPANDFVHRSLNPQSRSIQYGGEAPDRSAEAFSQIVKKEPAQYHNQHPFRGVVELGSWKYAFVFDSKDADSRAYDLLHFDLNHNGDLTDDKALEGTETQSRVSLSGISLSRCEFPRVDLTIDVDGKKIEYGVFVNMALHKQRDFGEARAEFSAAVYREGRITLGGKSTRVVLIDYHSNGRFDDAFRVAGDVDATGNRVHMPGSLMPLGPDSDHMTYGIRANGKLRPTGHPVCPVPGDLLLLTPETAQKTDRSPDHSTTGDERHLVGEVVRIDGKIYDLRISGSGDQLTLTPSSVPTGQVTVSHQRIRAVLYGDKGVLKIRGGRSEPISMPVGDWRLLAYTIDRTSYEASPDESHQQNPGSGPSLLHQLTGRLNAGTGTVAAPRKYTSLSAWGTEDGNVMEVRRGETVELPFGPPYRPVVKATTPLRPGQMSPLQLSFVGSGGEVCTALEIEGEQPSAPVFTITTPDGEVVEHGEFEYG